MQMNSRHSYQTPQAIWQRTYSVFHSSDEQSSQQDMNWEAKNQFCQHPPYICEMFWLDAFKGYQDNGCYLKS